MTKRLDNKHGGYDRDPHNWYREPAFPVDQLADAIDFGNDLIWDPCCGKGNVLDVFAKRGHAVIGSDIVDRHPPHRFYRGNFLQATRWPKPPAGAALSIVCNPPYGKQDGHRQIAQEIIWRALNVMPIRRAAFLLPIEFACGSDRFAFYQRFRPSQVAFCSQRPTMPPGHEIEALGDKAYSGGMADYCWIIWTAPHNRRCETIWLKPDNL
jgi:hypothetical protein